MFGVSCESIPHQINFLCDDCGEIGKGTDTVISKLHILENCGLEETEVYLHVDNCSGQNKNDIMVQYFMWRRLTGAHTKITYSLLLVT